MRLRELAAGVLALALLTGCAQSVDPIERLGRKAAQEVRPHGHAGRPVRSYRRWGLQAPLPRAPRPARAPALRPAGPALPLIVSHVPTHDRVVFLTYDDGAARDPRFADMVRELRLPVSVFTADGTAAPVHGHLPRPRPADAGTHGPRLGRTTLRGLPYAGQRAEICGRPDRPRPRLFRPPHGAYDGTTLRAAGDCGVTALVLWCVSMNSAGRLTYTRTARHLTPGDIVFVAPDAATGPPLTQRTSRLLARLEERGLTVGRLEDYL
ncbi:polysaccharide deacetylase family protein [Streptomyces sp. NPDC006668]|uniref:polysaccharide deacetylase family protein n=1 Tax=Streptomyces sp. NPDC006668 TaxID=3156903 RepID=UPI0033D795E7